MSCKCHPHPWNIKVAHISVYIWSHWKYMSKQSSTYCSLECMNFYRYKCSNAECICENLVDSQQLVMIRFLFHLIRPLSCKSYLISLVICIYVADRKPRTILEMSFIQPKNELNAFTRWRRRKKENSNQPRASFLHFIPWNPVEFLTNCRLSLTTWVY